MDKQDFPSSEEDFKRRIGMRRFDVNGATSSLLDIAELWIKLGQEHLGGIVSISKVPEDNRIDGEVLGKKFCLRYTAYGVEGDRALEVALTIQHLVTGENIVLSTFFISGEGAMLSSEGEELLNLGYRDSAYRALIAVVRRVMNASSTG